MSNYDELVEKVNDNICNTYGRYPVGISKAKGARLYDLEGKEYIDLLSGISVANVGHCRDDIAQVISDQSKKLVQVSNLFYQEEQAELAEKILKTSHAEKVFFCNSGAEANEAAIKLARRYMRRVKNKEAYEIITLEGSFHGRTLATLTATGQAGLIKDGFGPLPEGFKTVPAGDIEALKNAITDKTAAFMIEMIQGEGGIRPQHPEYIQEVIKVIKEAGILLICDEVQSGLCRSGKWWSFQNYAITPDIFTSAKALANGLPMGAMFATSEVARGFEPGSHATTFGGGALVSKVASKVVDIMNEEKLAERASELGKRFKIDAAELIEKHQDKIETVRGLGLMLGVQLKIDGSEIFKSLRDKGFILNLTKGTILRLLPPLTIEYDDLKLFLKALDEVLSEI